MGAMLAASSFLSSYGAVSVTASRTYVVQETTLHASETAGQNVLIYTLGSQSNKFVVAKDGLDRATRLTPVTEPGTTNVIGYYIGTNVNAKVASSDWMSKVSGLNPVYGQGEYSSSIIGYTLGDDTGKVVASADWLSKVTEVKPIISSDDSPSRVVGYTIGTNAYVFASDKSVEVQQVKKVTGSTTNVVGYTIGGNTNNVFVSIDGVKQVIPDYEAVSNAAMRVMSQISDGANVVDAARNVYRISHNSWFMYKYMTREYSTPHELYYQGNVAYSNIVSGRIGTIEDFYVSNRRFASKATIYGEEVIGDVFIGVEGSTTNVVITHARRSDGVYPIIWSYPSSVSNGVIYAFNNGNTECDIRRLTNEEVSTNFVGRLALTNDVVTLVKPGLITDGTNTIYASRKFVADSGEFEWRVTSGQSGTSHVLVGQKNQAQYVPENPQDGDEMWTIYFSPYEYGSKNGWWMFYVDLYSGGDWYSDVFYQTDGNIDDTVVNISLDTYVAEWVSSEVVIGKLALMSDFSTSNELLVATIESVSPKSDSDRITNGTNIIDAAGNVYSVIDSDWYSTTEGVVVMRSALIGVDYYGEDWKLFFNVGNREATGAIFVQTNDTVASCSSGEWGYVDGEIGNFNITFIRGHVTGTNLVGNLALTNDIPISKAGKNSYEIYGSLAQGTNVTASGAFSHAEGDRTVAQGKAAHAEGISTKALGDGSHSSGINTHVTQRGTFAAGVNISGTNSLSFIWNGNETSPWYGTHGKGTFNVNPSNGLNGFYIGDSTLQEAIVNSLMDTSVTNHVEVEVDGSNTTSFVTNHVPTIRTAVLSAVEDKIPEWPVELVHTNTPIIFADGQDTNVTSLALRAQPENYTSLSFMYPVSYYLPNRFSLLELGHEYQIAAAQWFQVGRYMYLPSTDRLVFCNGGQHRTFQEYLDACSPETIADLLSCYIPTNGGGRIHGDLVIDGRLTAGELITITNSDIHAKGFQVVNKVLTADGLVASNGMVRLNCARFVIGFGTPRIHLETNSPSAITYGGTWDQPAGNVFSWQEQHIEEYLAGNVGGATIEERNPYMRYNDAMDGFAGWPDKRRNNDVNNGPLKHFNLDNFSTYMFTDSDVGNYGIEFTIKSNAHVRIVYNFASTPPSSVYFSCGGNSGTMLSNGTELLSPTAGSKTLLEIEHLKGSTYMVKETPLTHQNTVMPWVESQEEEEP